MFSEKCVGDSRVQAQEQRYKKRKEKNECNRNGKGSRKSRSDCILRGMEADWLSPWNNSRSHLHFQVFKQKTHAGKRRNQQNLRDSQDWNKKTETAGISNQVSHGTFAEFDGGKESWGISSNTSKSTLKSSLYFWNRDNKSQFWERTCDSQSGQAEDIHWF